MVHGNIGEHFLNWKIFKSVHSFYKKRMSNNFPGTFFNRHEIRYKSGALKTKFSKIFYFLPSITDRVEEINRHMGSVNLLTIDIPEETLETDGVAFDTSKRDYENLDKEKMAQAVVKML